MSFHGLIDIFIIEDDSIVRIYHRLSVHLLKDMSVICNLGGVYIINIRVQVFMWTCLLAFQSPLIQVQSGENRIVGTVHSGKL